MTERLEIDRGRTALLVMDMQEGVAYPSRPTEPHSVGEVVANAARLAEDFRRLGMPVFLVRLVPARGIAMSPVADVHMPRPPDQVLPVFAEFVPEIGPAPSDVIISKRGADGFYSTELDLQLRRRGLDTIVLCGIATDYCVESTARTALEIGYQQVFAEDAMTAMSAAQHEGALSRFRLMGRVRKTDEIIQALE